MPPETPIEMPTKAHGDPSKEFFVYTITKDVSVEDCILDLLDNCIDGARKTLIKKDASLTKIEHYNGYTAQLVANSSTFRITDNCGGLSISEAIDYAFHFGRRPDAPMDGPYSIGLYGIGMKRAIFRLGDEIEIYSSTIDEAFRANINVAGWLAQRPPNEWDFDLNDAAISHEPGTDIEIKRLILGVAALLGTSAFQNELARIIGRDYFRFIDGGFKIELNGATVPSYRFTIREGGSFKPAKFSYMDEGVEVEIVGGMSGSPPDDLEPNEALAEVEYYGWFVLCNDRVVLASDKSDRTVWGSDKFPGWHYQYNGFVGFVSFHASNPKLLPWTSTKREIDQTNPIYRRAVTKMKELTRAWIDYTNLRKSDLDVAKDQEQKTVMRRLLDLAQSDTVAFPATDRSARQVARISYTKPLEEVGRVKKSLGNRNMTNRDAGVKTFDYYVKNELGD
jgi:hypothetical protein